MHYSDDNKVLKRIGFLLIFGFFMWIAFTMLSYMALFTAAMTTDTGVIIIIYSAAIL